MGKLYVGDSVSTPAIVKIKEVPKTKFGANVDTWIGDVDENGVLNTPTADTHLDFTGVKEIASKSLYYAFYSRSSITSVDLSSLQSVSGNGLYYAFYSCGGITNVDLSSLQSVGNAGMEYAFTLCKGIKSLDLSSLQTVASRGLANTFSACSSITSVDLSSLQSIGGGGMVQTFNSCSKLTIVSFPSLTSMKTNSFGSDIYNEIFHYCFGLTEIHFRADMQATIEALTLYASKWGATNATIYFDLIGTITVNGVAYVRNEPNSIRVDGTKTYVAWADENSNVVYTDATAEPAVDTPVYSDNGTTQVGTVSVVA